MLIELFFEGVNKLHISVVRSFANFLLPKPVKLALLWFMNAAYVQPKKKVFAILMQQKQKKIIKDVSKKNSIKVVFLAIHESVWKVDSVFKTMLEDDYFQPTILVCPYTAYGTERQEQDLKKTYNFFLKKGYPVIKSKRENGNWVNLEDLNPDLVFFTNPHNLTFKNYYKGAYEKYLSCYVPYFYLVTSHDGDASIYNQYFHNAMWKIFMPHSISLTRARQVSANNGRNCVLTGYPACEPLLYGNGGGNPWKKVGNRKKIIFAPHHTIDENQELNLSNFLSLAEFFKDLVGIYNDKVQWCFKPHPILKSKLYNHPDWGKELTDLYYQFWEVGETTQLSEGDYESLFIYSDAMIHDCGSFLAEYLYLRKPVLYLVSEKTWQNLNDFGRSALECCILGKNKEDITNFLSKIISEDRDLQSKLEIDNFFDEHVDPFFAEDSPSVRICNLIKSEIKGK